MNDRLIPWLLALAFCCCNPTHAYVRRLNSNGAAQSWFLDNPPVLVPLNSVNRDTKAIRYFLHDEAFSEENREAELNAVRAAFDQWQSIPDSTIRFEDAGVVSGEVDVNTRDGQNVVFWTKDTTLVNGETADISQRLGVTFTSAFSEFPAIAEADIVLNGAEQAWYTNYTLTEDNRQFVEGVALHEIGHLLGLLHTTIGAATMISDSGGSGVGAVVGLSGDELAFVADAYSTTESSLSTGAITGVVTKNGEPVYGASIVLEDQTGSIVTGGLTLHAAVGFQEGHYNIRGVPPGEYHLRVLPLESNSASDWLVIPGVIPLLDGDDVDTSFLPSNNLPITVNAGQTSVLDVTVEEGQSPFHITGIRSPTTNGFFFSLNRSGVYLPQGAQDYVIGVYGEDLPESGASISVTGPGITISPSETRSDLFVGLVHIFALVSIADDAPPGLRTLLVRKGADVAYAPGYFEIQSKTTIDYNFDGLDDRYQRRHFDPFTSPAAQPDEDPDNDGFSNREEAERDSDPNDPASIPAIQVDPFPVLSVSLTAEGSTVTFVSVPGATYQLYSKRDLGTDDWAPVGSPVVAEAETTAILDPSATEEFEFYRVETTP